MQNDALCPWRKKHLGFSHQLWGDHYLPGIQPTNITNQVDFFLGHFA